MSTRDGEYLLGIKRLRRLYCNIGIGFHIQVLPDGKVTGIHNENKYSKCSTDLVMESPLPEQTEDFNLNSSSLFMLNNDGINRIRGNDRTLKPSFILWYNNNLWNNSK